MCLCSFWSKCCLILHTLCHCNYSLCLTRLCCSHLCLLLAPQQHILPPHLILPIQPSHCHSVLYLHRFLLLHQCLPSRLLSQLFCLPLHNQPPRLPYLMIVMILACYCAQFLKVVLGTSLLHVNTLFVLITLNQIVVLSSLVDTLMVAIEVASISTLRRILGLFIARWKMEFFCLPCVLFATKDTLGQFVSQKFNLWSKIRNNTIRLL